jgi:hypothetical protein
MADGDRASPRAGPAGHIERRAPGILGRGAGPWHRSSSRLQIGNTKVGPLSSVSQLVWAARLVSPNVALGLEDTFLVTLISLVAAGLFLIRATYARDIATAAASEHAQAALGRT